MASVLSNLIIIGGLLYVGYYVTQNTDIIAQLQTLLKGDGGGKSTTTTPAPSTSTSPDSSTGSDGKSSGSCGATLYKGTGKTWSGKDTGPDGQKISYASGGGGASRRINHEGVSSGALECTIYFTFNGNSCHDGDKENMTIKAWGPKHSDNNCCWCLFGIQQNGDAYFGGEGPHPSTDKNQQKLASLGNLKGKKIGQKLVIWPSGNGAHQEAYVDLGNGTWKLLGSRDGQCGAKKKSSKPVSSQQIEFRIDCKGVSIDCSHVAEITAGSRAAYGTSSYYTGGMIYPQQSPRMSNYNMVQSQRIYRGRIPYLY